MRLWTALMATSLAALGTGPLVPDDPAVWLTYGKNLSGWRYSELAQINTSNVSQLAPKWTFQSGVPGKMEVTNHRLKAVALDNGL